MSEAKKVLSVNDVAKSHKMTAKNLRALLRRHKIKKNSGHYSWKEGDAALSKIAQLITDDKPIKKK